MKSSLFLELFNGLTAKWDCVETMYVVLKVNKSNFEPTLPGLLLVGPFPISGDWCTQRRTTPEATF